MLDHAFPVLTELGVPGTVFVASRRSGRRECSTGSDLETLVEAGWEIGSHTITHASLHRAGRRVARTRSSAARARRSRTCSNRPCRSIAYPYGAFDERVRAAVAAAGYTAGCTTERRRAVATRSAGPESAWTATTGAVLFRLKTSRLGRRFAVLRSGRPLERAGRAARAAGALGLAGRRSVSSSAIRPCRAIGLRAEVGRRATISVSKPAASRFSR